MSLSPLQQNRNEIFWELTKSICPECRRVIDARILLVAAAVLLAAGWKGAGNLVNPMCGSGTLAIEGALIAAHRPPGFLRGNFGFMHLQGYERKVWLDLLHQAEEEGRGKESGKIIATDISAKAVEGANSTSVTGNVFLARSPEVFLHDLDGNLCSDDRWTNRWDAENRLISMTTPASLPTGAQQAGFECAGSAGEFDEGVQS